MELEQLYYIGEMIGVMAVVGSLLFVGVQMRQNANAMRISAEAESVANWQSIMMGLAVSDKLVEAWVTVGRASASEELDIKDKWRVWAYLTSALKNAEFSYYRYNAKEIDEGLWIACRDAMTAALLAPAVQNSLWPTLKMNLSHDFASFLDGQLETQKGNEHLNVW